MNDCEFIRVVTKKNEECFLLTKLKNDGQEGFDLTLCCDGRVWTGSGEFIIKSYRRRCKTGPIPMELGISAAFC